MLKKLNYSKSTKDEVLLDLFPVNKNYLYPFPSVKRIEVYMECLVDPQICKTALSAYSVISKGDWLKVMIDDHVYKIYILAIYPKNKCIIKNLSFDLSIRTFMPKVFVQDLSHIRKKEKRIMSFERTKARFYEILNYREQTIDKTVLNSYHKKINSSENYNLRYSAYNWNHSVTPIVNKESNSNEFDYADLQPWAQDDSPYAKEISTQTPTLPPFSNKKILNFMNNAIKNKLKF